MSTTTTLGERLEARRQAAGAPSFRKLERKLVGMIGEYAPSSETLRRWHQAKTQDGDVDVFMLTRLAVVYGCSLTDLSESAAHMLSDQGISGIPWYGKDPGQLALDLAEVA